MFSSNKSAAISLIDGYQLHLHLNRYGCSVKVSYVSFIEQRDFPDNERALRTISSLIEAAS